MCPLSIVSVVSVLAVSSATCACRAVSSVTAGGGRRAPDDHRSVAGDWWTVLIRRQSTRSVRKPPRLALGLGAVLTATTGAPSKNPSLARPKRVDLLLRIQRVGSVRSVSRCRRLLLSSLSRTADYAHIRGSTGTAGPLITAAAARRPPPGPL